MTVEAWLRGAIPTSFASRTMRHAEESVAQQARSLDASRPSAFAALDSSLQVLATALERRDRRAVGGQLAALSRQTSELRRLVTAEGAP